MQKRKLSLKQQAKEIMRIAEESGVQSNFLFITTFQRYQVQLGILEKLEKAINEDDLIISKEYIKGKKNLYTNPAVTNYNRTADSASKTVSSLIRIIKSFNVEEDVGETDPLLNMINGEDE